MKGGKQQVIKEMEVSGTSLKERAKFRACDTGGGSRSKTEGRRDSFIDSWNKM